MENRIVSVQIKFETNEILNGFVFLLKIFQVNDYHKHIVQWRIKISYNILWAPGSNIHHISYFIVYSPN